MNVPFFEVTSSPGFLCRTAVVIPALNEEASVATAVRDWLGRGAAEVCVADNGSRDATAELAGKAGARVVHEPRRGYGAAAWAGTQQLPESIDWILFASADGSDFFDEKSARDFALAANAGAALVIGERISRANARRHLTPPQRFGNALCCLLISLGWRAPRYRDMGSLRLIRRDVFETLALRDRAFGWNIEMQVSAIEHGYAIVEVPVGYRPRLGGEPKISGSLAGSFRAGRSIMGMLAKLWWRKQKRDSRRYFSLRRGTVLDEAEVH